ncbi:MAG: ATP-binding protein [Solirubrobacterales bacterium]|nr:ATP-binding protein [Solirubrobacterales bacterium]
MFERALAAEMDAALGDTPVVLVVGPRQSGKSTLVEGIARGRDGAVYRTLDDSLTLGLARSDPDGFAASAGDGLLIVDEVQRAPDLLLAIKASVDRDRRPGRFILTGSADVLMLPRVPETLAGRMEVLRLWPLSQPEIEGTRADFVRSALAGDLPDLAARVAPVDRADLMSRVAAGGFPEAVARSGERRERWFASYVETVVQREIRDVANVSGLVELPRLLLMLAARVGGTLNYSALGRDLGIPQTTLKRYIALLEVTFLVKTLRAWYRNIGQRLVKSPKLALVDSGLMAHQLAVQGSGPELAAGPLLENFVAMELVKQADLEVRRPGVLHFRTSSGMEVDALLERGDGRVVGIEVKAADTVAQRDLRGLRALEEKLDDGLVCGVVLYTGVEARQLTRRLWALPVSALWA